MKCKNESIKNQTFLQNNPEKLLKEPYNDGKLSLPLAPLKRKGLSHYYAYKRLSILYDTGYPHDGRADKDSYPHDGRADKDSYPHDGRANSYPQDRHNQYIVLSL